ADCRQPSGSIAQSSVSCPSQLAGCVAEEARSNSLLAIFMDAVVVTSRPSLGHPRSPLGPSAAGACSFKSERSISGRTWGAPRCLDRRCGGVNWSLTGGLAQAVLRLQGSTFEEEIQQAFGASLTRRESDVERFGNGAGKNSVPFPSLFT